MADHTGLIVTADMKDLVVELELESDTDYMVENIGNQPVFLNKRADLPTDLQDYPTYFNFIRMGEWLQIGTGTDNEAFAVWTLDSERPGIISVVEV